MADQFLKIYPASNFEEATVSQKSSAATQTFYGMWNEARLQTKNTKSKAFLYMFTHAPPLPKGAKLPAGTSEAFGLGACHGAELVYQFMTLKVRDWPWTDLDFQIADELSSYCVNFAKTGDPNGKGLPQWPVYEEKKDMILEIGDKITAHAAPQRAGLEFYEEFSRTTATNKHRIWSGSGAGKPQSPPGCKSANAARALPQNFEFFDYHARK